ncbi:MAG TPA: 3-deoxy-manno-octulosonate cytidylyltransferase [Planctomycetota bacterium]|jgi:3-deoxy-manno-octulosonate cytidylyltransferase (CMP-KDO synthetase)|nr:3-deoxy-manno-octulosonate cytidylyltransferase [Planctomycetota bacterium]|tara:strand:- start:9237 stop:9986 length:750 start_codon:yes stop_codon:yes gene_type:complete
MTLSEHLVVVPARRAATRLPQKLLLAESGKPLLAHTLERCLLSEKADCVLAAVDCEELAEVARAVGAKAVLTDPNLPSGSDRVHAAVQAYGKSVQGIVNVQGDEPEMDPLAIDALFDSLDSGAEVVTLCAPLPSKSLLDDPAAVKVVRDLDGQALFFSRSPTPFQQNCPDSSDPMLHIGLYGYTPEALAQFSNWAPTPLELKEGLEQLRFLEHGKTIQVLKWGQAFPGIDTREDYDAFLLRFQHDAPST